MRAFCVSIDTHKREHTHARTHTHTHTQTHTHTETRAHAHIDTQKRHLQTILKESVPKCTLYKGTLS